MAPGMFMGVCLIKTVYTVGIIGKATDIYQLLPVANVHLLVSCKCVQFLTDTRRSMFEDIQRSLYYYSFDPD